MNFRQLSAKLENFMLLYQESFQIESKLLHCDVNDKSCVILKPWF